MTCDKSTQIDTRSSLDQVCEKIDEELESLCAKDSNSSFQLKTSKDSVSFSHEKLNRELNTKAPTVLEILNRIAHNKKNVCRRKIKKEEACIPAVINGFSILLYTRTQRMNACQTINTYILKKGQAKKQTYDRFDFFYILSSYFVLCLNTNLEVCLV